MDTLTTLPRVAIRCGTHSIVSWNVALRLIAIMRSYCSSDVVSIVSNAQIPALLTRMSSRPNFLTVASTRLETSASRVSSATTVRGRPSVSAGPTRTHSSPTRCKFTSLRPVSDNLAPSRASSIAVAAPIPEPAPVINASFPLSRSSLYYCYVYTYIAIPVRAYHRVVLA